MNPITHLDILKGVQAQIAGLDLDDPMAVEMAVQLGNKFEQTASRIRKIEDDARFDAIWNKPINPNEVMRQEAEIMSAVLATVKIRTDISSPDEEEAFESMESRMSHVDPVFRVDGVS